MSQNTTKRARGVKLTDRLIARNMRFDTPLIWKGKVEDFLEVIPRTPVFKLIVTSPPYNIGKRYEKETKRLDEYLATHRRVIQDLIPRLQPTGSVCWQVGTFVSNGEILPLDFEFHQIFRELGLRLRNRIIWRFGHGLHSRRRFRGRYEVILWYTKSNDYTFNLDAVRIPSKYPGKRSYKGKKKGAYSGHPLGKNPEDVWDIPNVKGNHVEKTDHPCQFPVGLIERLVLALTNPGDIVFDPYAELLQYQQFRLRSHQPVEQDSPHKPNQQN